MIYVVYNINGDVIGVATNQESAIDIFLERHAFEDDYVYNLPTCDQYAYLEELNRVEPFELNKMYYK